MEPSRRSQKEEINRLARWKNVANAEVKAAQMVRTAQENLANANAQASTLTTTAQQIADAMIADATARAASRLPVPRAKPVQSSMTPIHVSAQLAEASAAADKMVAEAKQQAKVLREETQATFERATNRAAQIVEALRRKRSRSAAVPTNP